MESRLLSDNLSETGVSVVELLPFIGLPPFFAMKYRGISLHPFGSGQILNPYAPPLQQSRSLFIPFLYPLCHFSALRLRYLKYKVSDSKPTVVHNLSFPAILLLKEQKEESVSECTLQP